MQAQNDLAVSSHWWYCDGHKDLQELRSKKSGNFQQPDLSEGRISSSLGCCVAHPASSVKQRQGWLWLRQPGLASCLAVSKEQAMRGKVSRKEESGRQAGKRWGKRED